MASPEIQRKVRQHDNDLEAIYGILREHSDALTEIRTKLSAHDARFDSHDARFDAHDARFDAHDARFDAIDARLDSHDARFDAVDARFDGVDAKLDRLLVLLGDRGDGPAPGG